jgi:RHS repeat-associated protein
VAIKETKYLHYAYPGYPGTPSGPYGDFAETQLQATSPTLAALLADPDTCGASVTSLTPYGSIYDMGRLVQYETEFIATVVKLEFDPSTGTYGCTFQYTQGVGAALSQRVLTCDMAPPGETAYHVVYEAGNNGAPYCAIPWTQARKQCDTCKGNPIGVFDGVKSETRTDYAGAGPQPLVFRRQYSSMLAAANYVSSGNIAADRYQPIGVGWTATYFQWLDYQSGSGFEDVTAYRPDGRIVKFRQIGGVFSPDDDVSMVLVPVLSGITVVGWQLTLADDTKEIYDAQGRLTTVRDRSGREQTIAYETLGARHPQSVTDAFGHTLGFNYDSSQPFKTLAGITLPDGSAIGFIHSGINNLTTVNYPIASGISSVTYHYELLGSNVQSILTGVTPEDGVRLSTFGYDGSRRGASTEHAGGVNKYTFTYNVFAGTTVVVDPLNTSRTYTSAMVAGTKRMATSPSTSGGSGDPKSNAYDTDGNVIARRDFNDNLTCYAYDTVRNLETARVEGFTPATAVCPVSLATYTPAAGTRERKITTTWHASFRIPTQIVEANRTTSFTHDAKGNVLTRTVTDTSIVPNVVRTWTNTYDTSGRMLTEDGPRTDATDVTTYVYYTCTTGAQCGQLQTVTNALSQVTTYNSYNAHGQPTQITDPNSVVTTLAYDLRLRLTDRCVNGTLPYCLSGELTHMDYWPNGLLKKITNPDSSYLQYTHDAAQRLTQINDALSNRINYTLDNMGNRTVESQYDPSNALTRTRSQVFNSLNQLWKQVAAAGTVNVTTTFGYDTNGNQNAINAPLARNSSQQFDELNRLKQITDPASGVTNFVYDAKDNLASVQDPRTLTTSYTYTGHGDLKTQTSPDTGLTANTYDSGGNLKTSTDARNAVTTYTYDSLNRVLAKAFKIGTTTDQTFTYSYDAGANGKGRLTGASDASHTMSWAYDAQGRATSKTQSIGANARTVGYGYTNGLLSTQTNPSGFVVTYGYTNGRVSIVSINGTTILNNVIYDPFGPARQWTWGNGTLGVRTYDTDGKITQIDSAGFSTLGYDDAFRITSITDAVVPANSWTTLGYDNLDRLNNAVKTGTTIGYTYDADGNRLTQIGSTAATYTNAGTSNRLSSVSGGLTRTYTYNTAGSALTTGATIHTYYNSGRMKTGRLTSTGTNTTYLYNALGQRIRKTGGTPGTVVYVYDEAGHLLGEYGSTGTLVQETIWLGDTPVATIRPKTGGFDILYVHTDHLNQPRKITRPSDNLKRWQFNPNPFGDGTPNENPAALGVFKYHLRFPGQYFDIESNLAYNYFRDYDSAIGRYVESDPIGLAAGVNTFAYFRRTSTTR